MPHWMKIYRVFVTVVLLFTCFMIIGCNSNGISDNNQKTDILDAAKVTETKEDRKRDEWGPIDATDRISLSESVFHRIW